MAQDSIGKETEPPAIEPRFLTDEQLRQGIELLFFAYRGFTSEPDRILAEHDIGRAHHRALYFIARFPDISVAGLLDILGVTKQSINRVLGDLVRLKFVTKRLGDQDRRQRLLRLTERGARLERRLASVQRARVRQAYREAGLEAVSGFRSVLWSLLDPHEREGVLKVVESTGQ